MPVVQVSEFTQKVLKLISAIPKGKVATYKQIAQLAGKPQGSRGVSWILHSCSAIYKLPWHRVVNSQGKISFDRKSHNFRQQKRKLESEGVFLSPDGKLDLSQFQWKKKPKRVRTKLKQPRLFS